MGEAKPDAVASTRDWRWWSARVGRTLVGAGVLLIAFVGYQLWGTGLQQDRAQDQLSDRFATLATADTAPPDTAPPDTAPPDTAPPDTAPPDTAPPDTAPPDTEPPDTEPPDAIVVAPGDPIGIIDIPSIGVRQYVVAGVSASDLRRGPGHFPLTPLPGEFGNAAIAGHRTTYGEPFAALDQVQVGDEVTIDMLGGRRYVYEVDSTRIVAPTDIDVVVTTEPDVARLTLVTCHPRWSASQRLVVSGVLVEESSSDPGPATVVVDPTDAPDDAVSPTDAVGDDAAAFEEGWFSDTSAVLPSIVWSAAVIALYVGIRWLGRRLTRRRRELGRPWPAAGLLVAVAAGAAPFVVCLYVAFENLSRLLPPGL